MWQFNQQSIIGSEFHLLFVLNIKKKNNKSKGHILSETFARHFVFKYINFNLVYQCFSRNEISTILCVPVKCVQNWLSESQVLLQFGFKLWSWRWNNINVRLVGIHKPKYINI